MMIVHVGIGDNHVCHQQFSRNLQMKSITIFYWDSPPLHQSSAELVLCSLLSHFALKTIQYFKNLDSLEVYTLVKYIWMQWSVSDLERDCVLPCVELLTQSRSSFIHNLPLWVSQRDKSDFHLHGMVVNQMRYSGLPRNLCDRQVTVPHRTKLYSIFYVHKNEFSSKQLNFEDLDVPLVYWWIIGGSHIWFG